MNHHDPAPAAPGWSVRRCAALVAAVLALPVALAGALVGGGARAQAAAAPDVGRNPSGTIVMYSMARERGMPVGRGTVTGSTEANGKVVSITQLPQRSPLADRDGTRTVRIWSDDGLYLRSYGTWAVPGIEGRWVLQAYPDDLEERRPGISGLASLVAEQPKVWKPIVAALEPRGEGRVPSSSLRAERWQTRLDWDQAVELARWIAPPLISDFTDLDGRLRFDHPQRTSTGLDAKPGAPLEADPAAKAKVRSTLEVWVGDAGVMGIEVTVDPRRLDPTLSPFAASVSLRRPGSVKEIPLPAAADVISAETASAIRQELATRTPGGAEAGQ